MVTEGHVDLAKAREALANEWRAANPQSPDEIAAFYKFTPNYDDDLNAWHSSKERQEWSQVLVAAIKASGAKRVLDIGAGMGHDLAYILEQLPDTIIEAVEPNDHMRKHIEATTGALCYADMADLGEWSETAQFKFDLIYCIDVLEHVPDPDALLEQMLAYLSPTGTFVEATATHDTNTPLHLPSLRGYSPSRFLDEKGFLVREELDDGRLRIWQRAFEHRTDEPMLLVCAYREMKIETVGCVMRLVAHGWRRSFHRGDALISRVRSIAVSKWYQEDAGDVFLMIDDDILFNPEDAIKVVELARKTEGIASAAYPVRGGSHLASRVSSDQLLFGPEMEPVEITWAGTGFIAVHRKVVEAIIGTMPICIMGGNIWFWPMFQPFVWHNEDRGYDEYLSEDWAFCERARQLGFKVWLDRSVVLGHLGVAEYNVYNMEAARLVAPPTDGGV